jgi:cysteinyl-tRNA synthetase
MEGAAESLNRLRDNVRRLVIETQDAVAAQPPAALEERFREAIADDLNIPGALAVTWEAMREANRSTDVTEKQALLDLVLDFDRVLGLRLSDVIDADIETLPRQVAELIKQREEARAARDWSTADALREIIRDQSYEIEDTPSGTRWLSIGDLK